MRLSTRSHSQCTAVKNQMDEPVCGARILKDGSVTLAGRYRGLFQIIYAY